MVRKILEHLGLLLKSPSSDRSANRVSNAPGACGNHSKKSATKTDVQPMKNRRLPSGSNWSLSSGIAGAHHWVFLFCGFSIRYIDSVWTEC